jgi:tetratricopeptide (TPR) repeat protein
LAHVRLAIITRNEAKTLPALAGSVKGLVDSWCIVDNGPSTDGTEQVARRAFADLPGEFHHSGLAEFDFSSARNEMLELARAQGIPGDYLLLLDPDSPPVGSFDCSDLVEPVYSAAVFDPHRCEWAMPVLLRADVSAAYVGKAHEYLGWEGTATLLADLRIERKGAGCDRARAKWIIDVLSEDADVNSRSAFYLANTLRDEGRSREAIEWYVKRAAMGGGDQETFWAIYQAGQLLEREGDSATAARVYLDAYGYRPARAEPLHALAILLNGAGEHRAANAFAEKGLTLAPTTDDLFVERWIEQWGLAFEHAAARWWLGEKAAAYATWERLVASGEMTSQYNELALRNLALQAT